MRSVYGKKLRENVTEEIVVPETSKEKWVLWVGRKERNETLEEKEGQNGVYSKPDLRKELEDRSN